MGANDREQVREAVLFGGGIWILVVIGTAIFDPNDLVATVLALPLVAILVIVVVKVRNVFR